MHVYDPYKVDNLGLALLAASIVAGAFIAPAAQAQYNKNQTNIKRNDFSDGKLYGMEEDHRNTDLHNHGIHFINDNARGGKVLKFVWKESEYDGSRAQKGHDVVDDPSKLGIKTPMDEHLDASVYEFFFTITVRVIRILG